MASTARNTTADPRRLSIDWIATIGSIAVLLVLGVPRIVSTPAWIDETYTVAAMENLGESLRSTHFTMSGYYLVLWLWARISTSVVWLRMFSLFCAIAVIFCVRKLAALIGGRYLAATAVIILPFLAMFQWKATEARAYGLEILLVSVCWLIVVTGKPTDSQRPWRWWLALGVLGVIGESLHGLFFLQYLPISAYLVLTHRSRGSAVRAVVLLAVPTVTAGLLWAEGASGVGTYLSGGPQAWLGSYVYTYFGDNSALVILLLGGSVFWLALLVRSTVRGDMKSTTTSRWVPALWVFLPMVGMTALSLIVNRFNPRYLAPIVPGLALLFAQVAQALNRWITRSVRQKFHGTHPPLDRVVRHAGSIAIIGLALLSSIATPAFVASPWEEITARVASDRSGDSCIIFAEVSDQTPEQVRTPFEVVWRERGSRNPLRVVSSDRGLGRAQRFDKSLSPAEVATRVTTCRSVWVLANTSYGADPTHRYLRTSVLKDEFRRDGSWRFPGGYVLIVLRRL